MPLPQNDPWLQGYEGFWDAALARTLPLENPYPRRTPEAACWALGHTNAQDDYDNVYANTSPHF